MADEEAVVRDQPLDNSEIVDASSGFKSKGKPLNDIEVAPEKPNKEYFEEFCKLYINNYILNEQLLGLKKENKELRASHRLLAPAPIIYRSTPLSGGALASPEPRGKLREMN